MDSQYNFNITIKRDYSHAYIYLDDIGEHGRSFIASIVDEVCSFKDPSFRFKSKWTRQQESGVVKLMDFDTDKNRLKFPIGLIAKLAVAFAKYDIGYQVIDTCEYYRNEQSPFKFNDKIKIRPYQEQAISKAVNARRGIVCCPTGSGKTLMAGVIIHRLGYDRNIFLVHRKELLLQTIESFQNLFPDEKIGVIGCGQCDIQPITVAMVQTVHLAVNDPDINQYGLEYSQDDVDMVTYRRAQIVDAIANAEVVIQDECHNVKSSTIYRTLTLFPVPLHVYGMSATPKDNDATDLMLWAVFEGIIENIRPRSLVDQGYLLMPVIRFIRHDCSDTTIKIKCKKCHKEFELPSTYNSYGTGSCFCTHCKGKNVFNYGSVHKSLIDDNDGLHRAVADAVKAYNDQGLTVAISLTFSRLGNNLLKYIPGSVLLTSADSDVKRKQIFDKLRKRQVNCLLTTLIAEGVDVPSLDVIGVLDGCDDGVYKQRIGRIMRRDPQRGDKKYGYVLDIMYLNATFIEEHSKTRYDICLNEEFTTFIH